MVELGAGRREMAEAFAEWRYVPVDIDSGALPESFAGVVFSNEFFDALPVEVAVYRDGAFREQRGGVRGRPLRLGRPAARFEPKRSDYLRRYFPPPEEGRWYEVNLEALGWMERIAAALRSGLRAHHRLRLHARARAVRFPAGTLMGYRRHTAREDVLDDPGRARHHRARELHRARRARRRVRAARPSASRRWRRRCWPPARPTSSPRRWARAARRGAAAPHAAQDAAVRHGRDVPGAAAEEAEGDGGEPEGKA